MVRFGEYTFSYQKCPDNPVDIPDRELSQDELEKIRVLIEKAKSDPEALKLLTVCNYLYAEEIQSKYHQTAEL